MLAGVLLKGYKVYKNVKFIPLFETENENMKLFIGPNGAGKSSILEALNAFFNASKWIQNTKAPDSYVAPIFLIEKTKIATFSDKTKEHIIAISNFLWSINKDDQKTSFNFIPDFFNFKDRLKSKYQDNYYLLLISQTQIKRDISFATFDQIIKDQILKLEYTADGEKLLQKEQLALNKIFTELKDIFTYIYIPTETNISEFLRLESRNMQELIDKKIINDIDSILTTKKIPDGDNGELKNILDTINANLKPYVDEVEKTIQQIDSGYKFQAEGGATLTTKDISAQIINAYYTKRKLKINGKSIADLSSGERKKALIDIIYSFLIQRESKEKEIILAIDEPEASLDMSVRYAQFERIEELAKNHQILIATHWYGSLPILQNGIIHHFEPVEDNMPNIRIYTSRNYFEDRKNDPNDIYFKSFSDLALSILSSLRSREINWLIVEGPEDKNYLEYYLKDDIPNLRILPVGGCCSVKVLYQHLSISLSMKQNLESIKGRVYCLVDTDNQLLDIENSGSKKDKLIIRRLQCQSSNGHKEVKLVQINSQFVSPTEIEEVLNPSQFYKAVDSVIKQIDNVETKTAFSFFRFNEQAQQSFIKNDLSILIPTPGEGRNAMEDKCLIAEFVDKNKFSISKEYCSYEKAETPLWTKEIVNFFEANKPKDKLDPVENAIIEGQIEELLSTEVQNNLPKTDAPNATVEKINESLTEPNLAADPKTISPLT